VNLRIGDHVRVVAPAGPLRGELLTAGVAKLAAWGLRVTLGDHVRDRHPTLAYLAGTDTDRAHDLQDAWCDPDVDAVFCARGGYGGLRLLDQLDWDALAAAAPKPLIGSSDTTALLHLFATRLAAPVVFGPMIATRGFARDPVAREQLRRCLFEPDRPIVVTGPDAGALVGGTAHGVTAGGNASLLAALTGAAPPPPDGAILLLEDVTEAPYRLDGIFTALLRAEWFTGVTGIALGSWTECGDPAEVEAVLVDLIGSLGIPTVWELGFGHCPGQLTIPMGAEAELDADNGTLTMLTPALS